MTPCVQFAPMIAARPGELTADEERGLHEHLAACAACRARLADTDAMSGMLADALMAEANRRDFSSFADGVLERIAVNRPRRVLDSIRTWARRHRAAAIASVLAPAAAAATLVVYFTAGTPPPEQHAAVVEVSAEDGGAMVLETPEGPVVLIGSAGAEGT